MKRTVAFILLLCLFAPVFVLPVFAASNTYTDADSGVTFTIPEGWEQEELSKDKGSLTVRFVSTKDNECIIFYSSVDAWSNMSASEKNNISRSEMNNTYYSTYPYSMEDVADTLFHTTADKVSQITYNGIQYFKHETTYLNVFPAIELIYIDNGWLYMLQFIGTSSNKLYSDFESLLNSIQYPVSPATPEKDSSTVEIPKRESSTTETSRNDSSNTETPLTNSYQDSEDNAHIIFAVIFLLFGVVIAIIGASSKNRPVKSTNDTSFTTKTTVAKSTYSCKGCGQTLPPDSEFCHVCGTKVEKE